MSNCLTCGNQIMNKNKFYCNSVCYPHSGWLGRKHKEESKRLMSIKQKKVMKMPLVGKIQNGFKFIFDRKPCLCGCGEYPTITYGSMHKYICGHNLRIVNPMDNPDTVKKAVKSNSGRKVSAETRLKLSVNNARIWKGRKLPEWHKKLFSRQGIPSEKKGKTFEEIYGLEKARELKKRIGITLRRKNELWWNGLTYEQKIKEREKAKRTCLKYGSKEERFIRQYLRENNRTNFIICDSSYSFIYPYEIDIPVLDSNNDVVSLLECDGIVKQFVKNNNEIKNIRALKKYNLNIYRIKYRNLALDKDYIIKQCQEFMEVICKIENG